MKTNFLTDIINKPVMIRTYSAGVHYGILNKAEISDGNTYSVKLINSVRVYTWTGANSLSQLATEGSKKKDSKLSVKVPSIYLKAIEIIEMTPEAVENLNNIKTWRYD